MMNFLRSRKGLLVIIIVAVLGWAGYKVSEQEVTKVVDMVLVETPKAENQVESSTSTPEPSKIEVQKDFNTASYISEDRRTHILYGDITGGGHLYGTGAPCKSEFPKHWSEDTIIKEVELIAANDNLNWEQQRNGYYVTEQPVGTVKVRVVKDRDGKNVVTAYPTNTPRNPCPANDN